MTDGGIATERLCNTVPVQRIKQLYALVNNRVIKMLRILAYKISAVKKQKLFEVPLIGQTKVAFITHCCV
jgi:hypothetical protein